MRLALMHFHVVYILPGDMTELAHGGEQNYVCVCGAACLASRR